MLIHVLPKLYVPGGLDAAVRLVDLIIERRAWYSRATRT